MLRFEWDETKAEINRKKHGVSFETAAKVFLDEDRIEICDEAHSLEEERFITIGRAGDILFVVYTVRAARNRKPLQETPLTVYVSPGTLEKAKALGDDYEVVLGKLLDKAVEDYIAM